MPLRRLERDNVANEIVTQDSENGDHNYVSFEFYPFHEGMTFAVYKGLLSSEARRGKTFCVVKALLDHQDDEVTEGQQLQDVVKRAKEAQRLAEKFNSVVGYEAIVFQTPCLAQVQRISDYIGLFRCLVPHEKRLTKHEHVIIEEFLEGDFSIFNTSNGTVPAINSNSSSRCRKKYETKKLKVKKKNPLKPREKVQDTTKDNSFPIGPNNLAQAFSHFTWHETKNLMVCDLKGVFSHNSYCFSNPTIHSLDSAFGSRDRGASGISEVFSCHRCTNVCREWVQFSTRGSNNAKNQINFCDQFAEQHQQQQHQHQQGPVSSSLKSNKNVCTRDNQI